jgi:tetratricopeptide (TPR) repeat protein
MGLHGLGARRAEARAHRILGLCALAQSQVQEGADYLSNAYELAEEASDALECMLSAFAEAGALLVLGDLKRSSQWGGKVADWARRTFRADWESACDFLAGRISFELGRYDEAGEGFGRVRAAARVYDEPSAALRAELWSARAAAYSGDHARARDLLARHPDDAEALWFLAELNLFEGDREAAATVSAQAFKALPGRSYRAADAVDWSSGYDFLEGRSLGFTGARSYLADQVGAFAAFTAGLVELKPELVLDIALRTREERLASLHPQAHLYHYYCYLDLAASGGGPLDPATVLSKSFKALQTRTARMEEASLKDEYLERNRWNREILAEARRHKLI